MSTTTPAGSAAALKGQCDRALTRIEAAVSHLTHHSEADTLGLALDLLAILQGPPPPAESDGPPAPLTGVNIRQRLADHLASSWPRLEYAGAADELAEVAMGVVTPVVDQLREAADAWRGRAAEALAQRDRARATAVTLEQIASRAEHLLMAGETVAALAVLRGDGRPPARRVAPSYTAAADDEG